MRIKQVKINGIRGFYYLEDSPHIIELDGKHLFLYGENGTGKSSFLDAIEWCLTGEVEESKTRRGDKREFLINKFCDKKDAPFVEIIYVHNGQEESFCRKVNSKTKFVFEDLAGDHFIDTKRIENFVIDTKQYYDVLRRLENLKENLSKIICLQSEIRKINNSIEQKQQSLAKTAEEIKNLYFNLYEKELNIEISKEEFDRNLISDLETIKENARRKSDAINEIMRLSQEWGRYKEIKQNSEKSKISKETLEKRMRVVKKIYDDICDFYEIYRRKYAERIAKELENISKNG